MAVQRDYTKPLTEEEPYLVQNKQSSEGASRLVTTTDWYGNPITDPDRSNPTRNRHESPLQTIMSFHYAIDREANDMVPTRPASVVAPQYRRQSSRPDVQFSRQTSSYSAYNQQQPRERQDYRDREYRGEQPPRADYRGFDSNGESSSTSSCNQTYDTYPPIHHSQEYSPPSTPTRPQQFSPPLPQSQYYQPPPAAPYQPSQYPTSQGYGIPSPEPDTEGYPRVPQKPVHSFVTRPATPPSDVAVETEKKKGKLAKLKRFSGLGKGKA